LGQNESNFRKKDLRDFRKNVCDEEHQDLITFEDKVLLLPVVEMTRH